MAQLGIRVMINALCGDRETGPAIAACVGKTIAAADVDEGGVSLTFDDGLVLTIFDDGQSCCEHRYMRTDDDPAAFVGARLVGVSDRDGDGCGEEGEYGEAHDIVFLVIDTDRGALTVSTHNEHNGYYGGFSLRAKLRPTAEPG